MNKLFLGALALAAIVAAPAGAFAATYAYVNTAGEVMTMEAGSPNTALTTAPDIAARSGVMLIEVTDPVVGDSVGGV